MERWSLWMMDRIIQCVEKWTAYGLIRDQQPLSRRSAWTCIRRNDGSISSGWTRADRRDVYWHSSVYQCERIPRFFDTEVHHRFFKSRSGNAAIQIFEGTGSNRARSFYLSSTMLQIFPTGLGKYRKNGYKKMSVLTLVITPLHSPTSHGNKYTSNQERRGGGQR